MPAKQRKTIPTNMTYDMYFNNTHAHRHQYETKATGELFVYFNQADIILNEQEYEGFLNMFGFALTSTVIATDKDPAHEQIEIVEHALKGIKLHLTMSWDEYGNRRVWMLCECNGLFHRTHGAEPYAPFPENKCIQLDDDEVYYFSALDDKQEPYYMDLRIVLHQLMQVGPGLDDVDVGSDSPPSRKRSPTTDRHERNTLQLDTRLSQLLNDLRACMSY